MGCGSSKSGTAVSFGILMTPVVKPASERIITVREGPTANIRELPMPACGSSNGVRFDMLMTSFLKPASKPHGCSITVRKGPSANICEPPMPTAAVTMVAERTTELDMKYVSSKSLTNTSKTASEASRYGSAESKDSGFGEDAESDLIITEQSSPKLKHVADIPEELPEADLAIDGRKMRTPGPMGHLKRSTTRLPPVLSRNKKTQEEADSICLEAILQKRIKLAPMLINELPATDSIVKRPVSTGGLAFDILMDGSEVEKKKAASEGKIRKKLPPCVRSYAKQQRLTDTITLAELEEKQRAEQRRKDCGQMRLERIWAQQEKDKQVAEAMAKLVAMHIQI